MWSRGGAFGLLDDPENDHPTYRRGCTLGSLASWSSAEARAAAWAWYWRRLAAVEAADRKGWAAPGDPLDPWPAALTWSDEQVSEVERWLSDGGEPPEVLR